MRILYISEVQWLSQVSRKHQFVGRFPSDWEVLFTSPMNARAGENSVIQRIDASRANVRYVSLPLPKPDSGFAPVRWLTGVLVNVGSSRLRSLAASFRPDIAVCSFIWAAPVVPHLRGKGIPVIYDCNDLHTEFYPLVRDEAERMFRELVQGADEVVASSRRLADICGRGSVIGNGVDVELFTRRESASTPPQIAASTLSLCEELIAYVGSVDERLDFDLIEGLVESLGRDRPRTGLVLIGRIFDAVRGRVRRLEERYSGSILFTGRVAYEELPDYLSVASVGIAPFLLNERTRAINPNKLYMYASMDMNVVSTPFSEDVLEHRGDVFIAQGAEAFCSAVKEALGDDERRRAVRERIALPNSWDEKAREFALLLTRTAGGGG